MRARRWLRVAGAAVLLALGAVALPLPRGCDPRREEVPVERYGELRELAATRSRAEVEEALRAFDPGGQLAPYYTLGEGTLELRPYVNDRTGSVRVDLRAADAGDHRPPHSWRRIALDPGHHGGTWSRLEKRHYEPPGAAAIREGDLAWASARLAERALRARGFEVIVLRGPPPEAPYPSGAAPGFDLGSEAAFRLAELRPRDGASPLGVRWLTPLAAFALGRHRSELVRSTPFELYTRFDLRHRATLAAAFAPDLTLSMHWDITESGKNGVLAFVPGNSVTGDLGSASQRFWAFRRILDGQSATALEAARAFMRSMVAHFQLPAMHAEDFPRSNGTWAVVDPALGVFARDLALLRRTPGVALVLEGPCVNHPDEYRRLLGREVEVDGRRYPARVQQYADAVVDAVVSLAAAAARE